MVQTQRQRCSSKMCRCAASYAIAVAIMVLGVALTGNQLVQAQSYSVLYAFTGGAEGYGAYAPVVLDAAGNLYGTAEYGGIYGYGTVFKLDTSGTITVLHSFFGEGQYPLGGLLLDAAGNLYGTTQYGGLGHGTVFKVDTSGNYTTLYSFTGGTDGAKPMAGVVRDAKGNIYGTTFLGGSPQCSGGQGCGVVFKLDLQGNETVLYMFAGGADGANPWGVILDKTGNLYGTTSDLESTGWGTVFKLSKTAKKTVLHTFAGNNADGGYPYAPLVVDAAGYLYGTTQYGGGPYGTVFKLNTSGKKYAVLHSFTGGADGAQPFAPVVFDPAGNLYGTTYWGGTSNAGTVFKVHKYGAESVLHTFGTDGGAPYAGLARDATGNLYGTTIFTSAGGFGYGVIFKLTP